MESYLIRGVLIGLIFGIPVGAVGTMTVHRTLNYGVGSGLLTGLGSSVADCLYACVGAFGFTIVSDFLLKYRTIINVIGGLFIVIMGLGLILVKREAEKPQLPTAGRVKLFLSSFAVGITNPAAILTFLFAFSYFGISENIGLVGGVQLVAGVFIGTYIWWGALTTIVSLIRKKTGNCNMGRANKVFGVILTLFGVIVLVKTFY